MKLPLIFFGVILLLVILTKWYKNRPAKETTPAKENSKTDVSKKKKALPLGTIVTLIILAAIGWFGYRYFSEYKDQPQPRVVAEKWYLSNEQYWKENGGMEQAETVKVDATEYSMYVIYKLLRRNGQYGEIITKSKDGEIYNGRYQYPGENGDIKLKKISATLYEGTATRPNSQTFKIQLIKSPL